MINSGLKFKFLRTFKLFFKFYSLNYDSQVFSKLFLIIFKFLCIFLSFEIFSKNKKYSKRNRISFFYLSRQTEWDYFNL